MKNWFTSLDGEIVNQIPNQRKPNQERLNCL